MMDFVINGDDLEAMSGLPHIQQLTYLRGIRPYMDVKTGIVGVKRRISHQSISEQLYVEPRLNVVIFLTLITSRTQNALIFLDMFSQKSLSVNCSVNF